MMFGLLVPATSYYVDSVGGNDSNTGTLDISTSIPSPLKTLAALIAKGLIPGDSVALKCDCTFREMLKPAKDRVQFVTYGTGDPPIITPFNIVNPASWTLTTGQSKTYQTTIAHQISEAGTAYAYVLEDGAIMARKNSIALVEANPGSFYCPHDAAMSTHNPYTLYCHPSDDSNPTSNGKTVEANARDHAIDDETNTGNFYQGLHLRGCGVDDGCMDGGHNLTLSRTLLTLGGKHHIVWWSGVLEDCLCAYYDPTWPSSASPYTAYAGGDPILDTAVLRRCFGVDVASFLSHSALNWYRGNHVEESILTTGISFGTTEATCIRSMISSSTGSCAAANIPAATLLVEHSILKQFSTAGISVGGVAGDPDVRVTANQSAFYVDIATGASRFFINAGLTSPILATNLTIANQGSGSTGYAILAKSSLTLNRSLIVLTSIFQFIDCLSFSGDNNVYVLAGTNNWFFRIAGNTIVNSFSAWKTATGQDANSAFFTGVTLADVFSGTIANGDFRINPATAVGQAIIARSAGVTEHWDFNTRAVVAGPPTVWPVGPATLAEAKTYIADPAAWPF